MTLRFLALLVAGLVASCHATHAKQCDEGMQYVVTGTGGECHPLTPGAQGVAAGKPAVPWTPPTGQTATPPNPGGLKIKSEWSLSGSYASNDVVTSGGVSYVCIGAKGCTGTPLDNALVWQKVGDGQVGGDARSAPPVGLPAGSNALPPPVPGAPPSAPPNPAAPAATGASTPAAAPESAAPAPSAGPAPSAAPTAPAAAPANGKSGAAPSSGAH